MKNVGYTRLPNGRRIDWLPLYLGFVLLFIFLGHINMIQDIGRPFGGFLSSYNFLSFGGEEYVSGNNPPWWPVFSSGQITQSDRIQTINGHRYRSPQVGKVYRELWDKGQRTVKLFLWRPNAHYSVEIPITRFSWAQFLEISIANFLVGFGFWLVAWVIYRGQPSGPLNRVTALLAGAAAGYGGAQPSALFPGETAQSVEMLALLFQGLIGPATIHLALLFPYPLLDSARLQQRPHLQAIIRQWQPSFLRLLYALGLGASFLFIISRPLYWLTEQKQIDMVEALDIVSYLTNRRLLGIAYLILLLRLLWTVLWPGSHRRYRRESLVLMFGLIASFIPILNIVGWALIRYGTPSYWGRWHLNYLLLFLPAALCVIIMRYKTFRPLPVTFMALPIIAVSMVLATWAVNIATSFSWPENQILVSQENGIYIFLLTFALLIISGIIWSGQSIWRGWLGRLLHWERTTLEDVNQFGQALLSYQDLMTLPTATAAALCNYLKLERAAVWEWQADAFHLISQAGEWSQLPPPLVKIQDKELLPRQPLRLAGSDIAASLPLYGRTDIEALAPLWVTAEPVGLLALGKRWDEAVFDIRDLRMVALIGQQIALFLLAARQVERLRQVPHQMSEVQERERTRLAQELHDTTEQFLGRLPFTLEEVRSELPHTKTADNLIQQCLEEIAQEARVLRRIRTDMAPIQLEHGFTNALERLVESWERRTELKYLLTIPPDLENHLPNFARLPLYRVIQQALDNIAEHAHAHTVQISLHTNSEELIVRVQDDGQGFHQEETPIAQKEGSFGLRTMTARLHAIGGELIIDSAPGRGTTITARTRLITD